jgi:hypothetical protein
MNTDQNVIKRNIFKVVQEEKMHELPSLNNSVTTSMNLTNKQHNLHAQRPAISFAN